MTGHGIRLSPVISKNLFSYRLRILLVSLRKWVCEVFSWRKGDFSFPQNGRILPNGPSQDRFAYGLVPDSRWQAFA
jgi:hypothetical protein